MANYYASCRTNYFKVRDPVAFRDAMEKIPGIKVCGTNGLFCLLGSDEDGGGWPSGHYDETNPEADANGWVEFWLPQLVAPHLAGGEVAIFLEVGAEKLRYLVGHGVAINSLGHYREVSLADEIHKKAQELTNRPADVTLAEY